MVNREAVNCERVWQEISNYLEGEVDAALRTAMDEHFNTCQRCTSVLEGTRNVIRLYSDERMIEVPAGFGRRSGEASGSECACEWAAAGRRGRHGWFRWRLWPCLREDCGWRDR